MLLLCPFFLPVWFFIWREEVFVGKVKTVAWIYLSHSDLKNKTVREGTSRDLKRYRIRSSRL